MAKKRKLTIEYVVKNQDGTVIASTEKDGAPLSYIEGSGEIVQGLEQFLLDKGEGYYGQVVISAENAFGSYDPEAVLIAQPHHFEDNEVEEGDEVMGRDDYEGVVFRVTKVNEKGITLDANHSLAGVDLAYRVRIIKIQEVLV